MQHYTYKTHGTCSRVIDLDIEGDIIHNVVFTGGCDGNLKAIPRLVEGMSVDWITEKLSGISCGGKPTSCGDQLARACQEALAATK